MARVTSRVGRLIRWRWRWRWRWPAARLAIVGVVTLILASVPWLWTETSAHGHQYPETSAPTADVVIVLGTEVVDGKPSGRLAGRLETAAALVQDGRARVILVSGDGGGSSGDEPAAMISYLSGTLGVDRRLIVADPYGLDTYDSCARARDVYGVTRALVVTQSYHLSRAVALCRHLGLDAAGVPARCGGCPTSLLVEKVVRDYFACGKAAWDAVRRRPPAIQSPVDPAVRDALSR